MNGTLHRSCIRFAPNELSILDKQVESVSWQGCCPYSDRKLFQSLTQLLSGSTLALSDLLPLFFDQEAPLRLCCLSIRCGLSFSDLNPGQAQCADNQFSLILKPSLAFFCSLSAEHLPQSASDHTEGKFKRLPHAAGRLLHIRQSLPYLPLHPGRLPTSIEVCKKQPCG